MDAGHVHVRHDDIETLIQEPFEQCVAVVLDHDLTTQWHSNFARKNLRGDGLVVYDKDPAL
ncbi:MAG: hypothetical protein AMXMBFR4_29160 [Candidatus Hydrogenedentota bacterium]